MVIQQQKQWEIKIYKLGLNLNVLVQVVKETGLETLIQTL